MKSLIDWYTIRIAFKHDPDEMIEKFLGMDPALFEDRDHSPLEGYRRSKSFAGITVCYDSPGLFVDCEKDEKSRSSDQMGVCISMCGSGCRSFETMSTHRFSDAGAFPHLIEMCYLDPDVSATRVDLAIDDHDEKLDMDVVFEYAKGRSVDSRIRKIRYVGDLQGDDDRGLTVYIGAPSSSFRVRIYDKAKEQFAPEEPGYNDHWIRVEMVMRGKQANGFLAAFCNSNDLGALAAGILNDKLRFIERDDSNITRCSTAAWWLEFVKSVERIKLLVPETVQHTIDRMGDWLTAQISPCLATFYKAYGWTGIKKLLEHGGERMSAKHRAILDNYNQQKLVTQILTPGAGSCGKIV